MLNKTKHFGFSLIEVMAGTAVFLIFAIGIYSGTQFVFKVVHNSRLRILETGILNEQIEIIRNLPFEDVGIVNGSPSGVLARTAAITRNGVDFTITRTIRNVDDPFDGTIGGTPNDLAPADYKLVEVEVICDLCFQTKPTWLITSVSPKLLEGDPTHGALFIEVFDANGNPVQGADVHVVATATNPTLDLTDTTDNDGMLRLVDLGAGMSAYSITVSKTGYTTDQTIASSEANPNPVKGPASVEAQNVTEISFSIDAVSQLDLSTINNYCSAVGNVSVGVMGTKLLGTDPEILKVDESIFTDSNGNYSLADLEWDAYGLPVLSGYDLIGSIPILPISLPPGVTQPAQLIVGSNTANSLLVNVTDNTTGQPISNASVHLSNTDYNQTKTTGIGFARQTDWSSGSGQLNFVNELKYWNDDGKVEVVTNPGDIILAKVGGDYFNNGALESSVFDLGTNVNFVNLIWEPLSQPIETGANSARWQIATSLITTPASWNYLGPDGTVDTYYDAQHVAINEVHNGDRYFRYKLFLSTESVDATPTISDFMVTYTTACTPPGQSYFGNLSATDYTVEVSKTGYQTATQTVTVSSDMILGVEMVSE